MNGFDKFDKQMEQCVKIFAIVSSIVVAPVSVFSDNVNIDATSERALFVMEKVNSRIESINKKLEDFLGKL